MTSTSILLLAFGIVLFSSLAKAEFNGDVLNKAQFAVGLGKRSMDSETFRRAQVPMGFGKRNSDSDALEVPIYADTRMAVVDPNGETETVYIPMGGRIYFFH